MSKKRKKKEKRDRGTHPGPTFGDEITSIVVWLFLIAMVGGMAILAWRNHADDLSGVLDPILDGIQGFLDRIAEAGR